MKFLGFTLAELLISLAILGVIATFTIPKVLNSSQNSEYNAIAKESAGMFSEAYQQYKLDNVITSSFRARNLTSHVNYISIHTSNDQIDGDPITAAPLLCSSANPCTKLANGAMIMYSGATLTGTTNANCSWIMVDPDGILTNRSDSIWFVLYFNGRLSTWESLPTGCSDSYGAHVQTANADPDWFSWN